MYERETLKRKRYNNLFFAELALKFNTDLQITNNKPLSLTFINNELRVYILLLVLEEIHLLSETLLNNKIRPKKDYIIILIFINSVKKLNGKLPNLFSSLSYSSKKSLWNLENLELHEGFFVNELFYFLLSFNAFDEHSAEKMSKFFSLILENLVIKITDSLVNLYLFQRKYNPKILKDQISYCLYSNNMRKEFQNNLPWSLYIKESTIRVKNIYKNIYPILIFDHHCLCNKKIFYPRLNEKEKLSNWQIFVLFFLEFVDFIKAKFSNIIDKLY